MKLTYLGTAASEGFPAMFCNCEYCAEARVKGGKNIRTRSQAIINDDLLIDLPADTYFHTLSNGLRLDKVKTLLITHSHSDHFSAAEFLLRGFVFAHNMAEKTLNVFTGRDVYNKYKKDTENSIAKSIADDIEFNIVEPFVSYRSGNYEIVPLPARHQIGTDAFIFVVSDGEKTILYAHDTGYFYEEVFDFIAENNIRFDLVSMDCTNINIPISNEGTHMGIENVRKATERLRKIGAVDNKTLKYINHFSHNANPMYDELCKIANKIGYFVAYDGLKVEI